MTSTGTISTKKAFGAFVIAKRQTAGLTQRELADRLSYGEDLIGAVECGRRTPQPDLLKAADELLNAGGLLTATTEDVIRAKARARVRHPTWFRDYARLEREAVELHEYSNHVIPGLLQTEAHARALFAMRKPLLDEATVELRVTARLARQHTERERELAARKAAVDAAAGPVNPVLAALARAKAKQQGPKP